MVKIDVANSKDCVLAECGLLKEDEVRRVHVSVVVDVNAMMLALPEEMIESLGLLDNIAGWRHSGLPVTDSVLVEAGGRRTHTNCLVLPAGEDAVVGQTIMRAMDLVIDRESDSLVPHPLISRTAAAASVGPRPANSGMRTSQVDHR